MGAWVGWVAWGGWSRVGSAVLRAHRFRTCRGSRGWARPVTGHKVTAAVGVAWGIFLLPPLGGLFCHVGGGRVRSRGGGAHTSGVVAMSAA